MTQPKSLTESFFGPQNASKKDFLSVRTPRSITNLPDANASKFATSLGQSSIESDSKPEDFVTVEPRTKFVRMSALKSHQLWQGRVTRISNNHFYAVISDQTNPTNPDEEAEFDFDEIPDDDKSLVRIGSTFYWVIGMERSPAGTQKRVSMIQFKRSPKPTESSRRRVEQLASSFAAIFG